MLPPDPRARDPSTATEQQVGPRFWADVLEDSQHTGGNGRKEESLEGGSGSGCEATGSLLLTQGPSDPGSEHTPRHSCLLTLQSPPGLFG